jgi:anhydro-N-acetylmuramic acid kinase
VNDSLLQRMLSHPYFSQALPKSTGREAFDLAWLTRVLKDVSVAANDVQATLCALTAHTITLSVTQYQSQCQALYVCGGGAMNPHLMQHLKALLPCPVMSTDALGVAPQQMEALAFAWLARQCMLGLPGNLPSVTGAAGLRVLGTITPR